MGVGHDEGMAPGHAGWGGRADVCRRDPTRGDAGRRLWQADAPQGRDAGRPQREPDDQA